MTPGAFPLKGRSKQRAETRSRVFEAALQIFRRDGVDAAKIDDITAIAGVSRGSFYFHYPTKEHVLLELLAASELRVAAKIDALPANSAIDDVLGAAAAAISAEWEDDAALFVHVGMASLKRTHTTLEDRDQNPVRRAIAVRFREASARGELTPAIPGELLADLFLLQQFAVAIAWCVQPIGPLELALRGVGEIFLRGAAGERKKKKRK